MEILAYPFMQRALIAGSICAILLGWLGVYAVSRKMSFIGDGIAHASLAAVALALLFGWAPLPVALVASVILAAMIHALEQHSRMSHDSAIGIIFVTGMALGIVLLQQYDGYAPELMSYLFGNILAIRQADIWTMAIVGTAVLGVLAACRRQFVFLTVDSEGAALSGISRSRYELLLTILISVTVVLSIKVIGIVLVSGLLVLPSVAAKLLARTFADFELYGVLLSLLFVLAGMVLSFYLDLPTGAAIVLVGAAAVGIISLFRTIKK